MLDFFIAWLIDPFSVMYCILWLIFAPFLPMCIYVWILANAADFLHQRNFSLKSIPHKLTWKVPNGRFLCLFQDSSYHCFLSLSLFNLPYVFFFTVVVVVAAFILSWSSNWPSHTASNCVYTERNAIFYIVIVLSVQIVLICLFSYANFLVFCTLLLGHTHFHRSTFSVQSQYVSILLNNVLISIAKTTFQRLYLSVVWKYMLANLAYILFVFGYCGHRFLSFRLHSYDSTYNVSFNDVKKRLSMWNNDTEKKKKPTIYLRWALMKNVYTKLMNILDKCVCVYCL